MRFPTLDTRTLQGVEKHLPTVRPADRTLLALAFQQRHQRDVDEWISGGQRKHRRIAYVSPYFLSYLGQNVAPFGSRAEVIEGFVGPIAGLNRYSRDGDTGGFQRGVADADESVEVTTWVTVPQLLAKAAGDLVIWKTDTDGFDIHLVTQHWEEISTRCDVIWMEFDPVGTLGPSEDIGVLLDLVAASGREVHVYDNVGHHMCGTSGSDAARILADLAAWVRERRRGFAPVLYFDIWIATPDVAGSMWKRS